MQKTAIEKLPDRNAYLERIGLAGRTLPLTVETLDTIILTHLQHIPFENLDAWDRHEAPVLDMPGLFDKIVLHRRGGWCFEQNALLESLLTELGFEVYPVGVRVMVGRDGIPAISHRGEICVLEGKHYYCDVGFGGELFRGTVPMDGSLNPYGYFIRTDGEYTRLCKNPEAPETILMFIDRPFEPVDYVYANYTNAVRPGLPFREKLYVSILTPEGHRKLLQGMKMQETCGDEVVAVTEAADRKELTAMLAEHFLIDYSLAD